MSLSELVLVTNHFPHSVHDEFLSTEIRALGEAFDLVTLAPLRPILKYSNFLLPRNVRLDMSLARDMSPSIPFVPERAARVGRRVARGLQPGGISTVRCGFATGSGIALRARRGKDHLQERADYMTIREWARSRSEPALAYTFWLGAATSALADAWDGTPVLSRGHGGDIYDLAHPNGLIPLKRQHLAAVTAVRVVSKHGAALLRREEPSLEGRVGVSYLGIPRPVVGARPSKGGSLSILSVSAITSNKRVDRIAQIVQEVQRLTQMRVHWTHFGDGPEINRVRREIAVVDTSVECVLAGHVSSQEIAAFLREQPVDAFINFSQSEGAPVSLMEAQALGLVTLATNVGGVAEVAPPHLNAIVSPLASNIEAAAALLAMIAQTKGFEHSRMEWFSHRFDAAEVYPRFATQLLRMSETGEWPDTSVSWTP